MPRDANDDSEAFVCEVCWHYFVNEMTQAEVAGLMGVTRLRVNQAIQKARALGMVHVQIDSPFVQRVEMQSALQSDLGIRRAQVAPANRDDYSYHSSVGAALASYLHDSLRSRPWRSIGVSWGVTLEMAIRRLPNQTHPELEILSMMGGTSRGASFNSFGIASGFAKALGASYSILAAPIYLSRGVDRAQFLAQDVFDEHFAKLGALDAAILTASDVSERSFLVANGLPAETTRQELIDAGAVGDVLGHFLDSEGRSISHPIDDRTIGVDIETVSRVPEKILAAAGPHKVAIIRAAAKRGLIDTLVTDDVTAEMLLGRDGAPVSPVE